MILDIRGTHGSGKSWIVHQLLGLHPNGPEAVSKVSFAEDAKGPEGYYIPKPINTGVVGMYNRTCGGCDGIKTVDEICNRVRTFSRKFTNVVFEGILVAHTFQRYSDLADELGEHNPYVFCFLDTPLETCIQRVEARRKAEGKTKPLNPKNLIKDWHQIWEKTREKMSKACHMVVVLNHRDPLPQILKLLKVKSITRTYE